MWLALLPCEAGGPAAPAQAEHHLEAIAGLQKFYKDILNVLTS